MAASRVMELLPGDIGPTGRPLPAFPEPKPLTEHGPARIVAVCNQKGGVGKTTTTINLGAALAERGRKMLLVDFDPQGALSVGLGIQPHDIDSTVYNLLMERGVKARDVIFETGVPNLDLLPSNIDLSGAEVQLVSEVGREFILGGALKEVVPDYDYIMIDCQPSLGLLTINALACANSVLIPLECEYFAMRGRGAADGDHRQGAAAAQPGPGDRRPARHDVRFAHPAHPGSARLHREWLRRQGLSYGDQPHGEVPGRYRCR